jgi:hypothetical protein
VPKEEEVKTTTNKYNFTQYYKYLEEKNKKEFDFGEFFMKILYTLWVTGGILWAISLVFYSIKRIR